MAISEIIMETLEEMAMQNKEVFQQSGGGEYRYIPALNDSKAHMEALADVVQQNVVGWPGVESWDSKAVNIEAEQSAESGGFLVMAFPFALFLMAGILLVQFNSFYSVLLILSSVILSTIGVLIGHLVFQSPFFVVMSGIGVFALADIVVNNNIVLIDTYDRLYTKYNNDGFLKKWKSKYHGWLDADWVHADCDTVIVEQSIEEFFDEFGWEVTAYQEGISDGDPPTDANDEESDLDWEGSVDAALEEAFA